MYAAVTGLLIHFNKSVKRKLIPFEVMKGEESNTHLLISLRGGKVEGLIGEGKQRGTAVNSLTMNSGSHSNR